MAFDIWEASRWGGRPDEFYVFHVVGGETYRYTSMRLPISYQGFEYAPKAMQRGNFTFKKDFSGDDTFDIEVQADLELLSNFKVIVPRRTMLVTVYRRHRGDGDLEVSPIFFGRVRGCSWQGAKAVVSCDSMYAMTKRGGLNMWYQVQCNHFVYDNGCGLAKGDWKVTGVLQSMAGTTIQSPAFAQRPDGWFKYGFVEVGNGSYFIIDHKGDKVTTLHAVEGVPPGTQIDAFAGCDRTLDTCWEKFQNGLNHLGFHWSPADNVFTEGL